MRPRCCTTRTRSAITSKPALELLKVLSATLSLSLNCVHESELHSLEHHHHHSPDSTNSSDLALSFQAYAKDAIHTVDDSSMLSACLNQAASVVMTLEDLMQSLERNLAKKTYSRVRRVVCDQANLAESTAADPTSESSKRATIQTNRTTTLEMMQAMEAWISTTRAFFVLGADALSSIIPSMLEYRSLISLQDDVDHAQPLATMAQQIPDPILVVKQGKMQVSGSIEPANTYWYSHELS